MTGHNFVHPEPCECKCGKRYCASNRASLDGHGAPRKPEPVKRENRLREQRMKHKRLQDITGDRAHHRYQQWTGAELELLERNDLTYQQIATMTGRTYDAVHAAKKRLRLEPKYQRVLRPDPQVLRIDPTLPPGS